MLVIITAYDQVRNIPVNFYLAHINKSSVCTGPAAAVQF